MENNESSVEQFCQQILSDAEAQRDKAMERAKRVTEERMKGAQTAIERYRDTTLKQAEKQAQAITRRILSSVSLESKKILMKERGAVIEETMNLIHEQFLQYTGSDDFAALLPGLIVHGINALQGDAFVVSVSKDNKARLNESFITDVTTRVKEKLERDVTISLSETTLDNDPGVIVYTQDGRMLCDNTAAALLNRYRDDLRLFVHKQLFE